MAISAGRRSVVVASTVALCLMGAVVLMSVSDETRAAVRNHITQDLAAVVNVTKGAVIQIKIGKDHKLSVVPEQPQPAAAEVPQQDVVPTITVPTTGEAVAQAAETSAPTFTPTLTPTFSPTLDPTFSPDRETAPPTLEPSSANPTLVPTLPITDIPTINPTSASPTIEPTEVPTFVPTFAPTLSPTPNPTPPTPTPTFDPSSLTPTLAPTTWTPTVEPTQNPASLFGPSPMTPEQERGCVRTTTMGKQCAFPFFYNGKHYWDCTTDGAVGLPPHPWCATNEMPDGQSFAWGFCRKSWDCTNAAPASGSGSGSAEGAGSPGAVEPAGAAAASGSAAAAAALPVAAASGSGSA